MIRTEYCTLDDLKKMLKQRRDELYSIQCLFSRIPKFINISKLLGEISILQEAIIY